MSTFKLNLPTDIPWERICVTEDMLDETVCDDVRPAKWQTSLAVFRYVPPDEFQEYPNHRITYLKVAATITGYQPIDMEIQGEIDWDDVNVSTIPGLKDLLNAYHPCHGAILQVTVGPPAGTSLPLGSYPYIMDFEPKKRELYEMATDTQEKQSRSIESLNITKSSGNTQSLEVLDIDTGGGGVGGTAYGFGVSVSNANGQWGSKRVNSGESLSSRSQDVGQEKRETYSFSTQLSQMYHLLDSYHLGTNRAVFFIQPRPHTLDEPSGFVRGPRPVDGIQEFFLIVSQQIDQEAFCVSLRLDTSHLTNTPIMDTDKLTEQTDLASASADLPSTADTAVSRQVRCTVDYWLASDDIYYKHFVKKVTDSVGYAARPGYHITGYDDATNVHDHGSSSVALSPDRRTLTINAEANSSVWIQDEGDGWFADCPDELDQQTGLAQRRLNVYLESDEKIKQIGEEESLMITTRGLCCCESKQGVGGAVEMLLNVKRVPDKFSVLKLLARPEETMDRHRCAACNERYRPPMSAPGVAPLEVGHAEARQPAGTALLHPHQLIRAVNQLSDYVRTETIKTLNDPAARPQRFAESHFFTRQLETRIRQTSKGRRLLEAKSGIDISSSAAKVLEARLQKKRKDFTRGDLLSLKSPELAQAMGLTESEVEHLRLTWLGVKFKSTDASSALGKGPAVAEPT